MHAANLGLLAVFWSTQLARWGVWVGLVVLTVSLLLLMRTRWGQSQPLGKCVVLSLLAHLLLAIYLTTFHIVTHSSDSPTGKGVQVALASGGEPDSDGPDDESNKAENPWDAIAPTESSADLPEPDFTTETPVTDLPPLPEVERTATGPGTRPGAGEPSGCAAGGRSPRAEIAAPVKPIKRSESAGPQAVELPAEPVVDPNDLVPPTDPNPPQTPTPTAGNNGPGSPAGAAGGAGDALKDWKAAPGAGPASSRAAATHGRSLGRRTRPRGYRRHARNRGRRDCRAQIPGLRAKRRRTLGPAPTSAAGTGLAADGEDRQGAGTHADTALTGLALLTFLASGHTHLEGTHRETVRRGLEFLLVSQEPSGCLGATTNTYERMYCHAMASCALSEAYAMTRDKRLLAAVRNAIHFSVRTQDRPSGGWRYLVGQSGDTSQLGWQVMALKSAELGRLPMPADDAGRHRTFSA